MKKFYIDSDFKCHTTNPDGVFRELEDAFFDGKCDTFIEGYRYKPERETFISEDGFAFSGGKMITPWKDHAKLEDAQREYEREKLADAENALAILLGGEST